MSGICIACKLSVDEGNHGACVLAIMSKLAEAISRGDHLEDRLRDAGIMTRSKR